MNQLEKRITILERRNRIFMFSLFGILTILFLTAFQPKLENNILKCSRLEILDNKGQIVAFLGIDNDGSRGLFINDEKNRLRVATIHDMQQSAFYAFDSSGTVRDRSFAICPWWWRVGSTW